MRQEAFAGEPGGWQQTLSFQHRAVALATNLSLGPGSEADGPFPKCRRYSRQEQVFSALCPAPCTALAAPCQPPGHPDPGHRGGSCLLAKGSRPQGQPSVAAQRGRSSGCLLQEGVKSNCFLPKRQLPLADQTASAGLLAASSLPRPRVRRSSHARWERQLQAAWGRQRTSVRGSHYICAPCPRVIYSFTVWEDRTKGNQLENGAFG